MSARIGPWADPIGTISMSIKDEPWIDEAICPQTDVEAFFVDKGGSTAPAKKICLLCPVRRECLQYALDHDERFGVWGGLSERERRRLKRGDHTVLNQLITPAHAPSYNCYRSGCRLPECCDANAEYMRDWRNGRKLTGGAA